MPKHKVSDTPGPKREGTLAEVVASIESIKVLRELVRAEHERAFGPPNNGKLCLHAMCTCGFYTTVDKTPACDGLDILYQIMYNSSSLEEENKKLKAELQETRNTQSQVKSGG